MRDHDYYAVILIAGLALTFNAGLVNIILLDNVASVAVSHMTGNVSRLGGAIAIHNYELYFFKHGLTVLSFFLGAVLGGVIINKANFSLNNSYGRLCILEAILIFSGMYCMNHSVTDIIYIGHYCVASAMGLQNSMTTTFSKNIDSLVVIRTTHMTGLLTDCGVRLGHLLRGDFSDIWKLKFFVLMLLSFVTGSYSGYLLKSIMGLDALWISIFICVTAGIISYYLRYIRGFKSRG